MVRAGHEAFQERGDTTLAVRATSRFAHCAVSWQIDTDGNGTIDKDEFSKWVGNTWKCSGAPLEPDRSPGFDAPRFPFLGTEAAEIFKIWDVSEDSTIGPYEYCTLMAVFHAENELQQIQAENEQMEASPCWPPNRPLYQTNPHRSQKIMGEVFPCGINCFMCTMYTGLLCCCCTCGLSMCPMYCTVSQSKVEDMKKGENSNEEVVARTVLAATKKTLLKGPSDSLKTVVRDSQGNSGQVPSAVGAP